MKKTSRALPAVLWGALAAAVAMLALRLCLAAPGATPLLLASAGDPGDTAAAFLDTLCAGDYAGASAYVLGGLPAEEPPTDADAARVWARVRESWRWEREGEAIVVGTGARQAIRLSCLDAQALTAGLTDDVNARLARYVEQAALASEVYNADNSYREEVVLRAWNEALDARLSAADGSLVTTALELELRYADGAWQVLGSEALMRALSGSPESGGTP